MPRPPVYDTPGTAAASRIVGIQSARVNRTTLCNKSEKWKSPSPKKKRASQTFETPATLQSLKSVRARKRAAQK
jgi:hypothetical protein